MKEIIDLIDDLIIDIESDVDHRDYEDENRAQAQTDILEKLKTKVSQMQLPVKPVDYGTCKNCIFNLETDENSLVSECQLTIDEFTGIGLQFGRDFGCNQWQSKPSV